MKTFKLFATGYLFVVLGLFFYSYTQVDLNLTLSQWPLWQVIQTSFQHIGWFQRPLSTMLYLILLSLLFIFYFLLLWMVKKNTITVKQFWQLLISISFILLFSYNAFSYDLFNYMFDARIVTFHHENPYFHKALDYPQDPWITFMRWTHRTYPYGPAWLTFTVPPSFIGMQFFLPTLFLFKALMSASFLGTVYYLGKIAEKNGRKGLLTMAFFAYNPLVLIESLVSAHHDIVMVFLSVISIYFLVNKKYMLSFLLLFLSIGIKFATVFLLPFYIFVIVFHIRKTPINWQKIFFGMTIAMFLAIVFASWRTEMQPWYMLWVLPFASLLPKRKFFIPLATISLGLLLHYAPFLYTGNWDPPIPTVKIWLTTGSVLLGSLVGFLASAKEK